MIIAEISATWWTVLSVAAVVVVAAIIAAAALGIRAYSARHPREAPMTDEERRMRRLVDEARNQSLARGRGNGAGYWSNGS